MCHTWRYGCNVLFTSRHSVGIIIVLFHQHGIWGVLKAVYFCGSCISSFIIHMIQDHFNLLLATAASHSVYGYVCRRQFYDKRLAQEVVGDHLGDEFKGYVFKIMGGCDKQGFPMKQGVLTQGRVRLLMHRGNCFRDEVVIWKHVKCIERLPQTRREFTLMWIYGVGSVTSLICYHMLTLLGAGTVISFLSTSGGYQLWPYYNLYCGDAGASCFRGHGRRNGERRRKSVRGCIVSPDLSVLNLVIVKQGILLLLIMNYLYSNPEGYNTQKVCV